MSTQATAPEKPAFGSPCNGCGLCCAREVCKVGLDVLGDVQAPCPAMEYHDGRFRCGLVLMADEMGRDKAVVLRLILGIGIGCDAETSDETTAT